MTTADTNNLCQHAKIQGIKVRRTGFWEHLSVSFHPDCLCTDEMGTYGDWGIWVEREGRKRKLNTTEETNTKFIQLPSQQQGEAHLNLEHQEGVIPPQEQVVY